ncbi:hypothetical protein JCM15519_38550 [Fundidesulfovibrio butyratiphilus]
MADDGRVIEVDFTKRQPPVIQKTFADLPPCSHKVIAVDRGARRVFCDACGQELDPIQVLIDQASGHRRVDHRIQELRKLQAEMSERETLRLRLAADQAKNRLRIVSGLQDAGPGERVVQIAVKCRATGNSYGFFVAIPTKRWRKGFDLAVLELLAPRLFNVFQWVWTGPAFEGEQNG